MVSIVFVFLMLLIAASICFYTLLGNVFAYMNPYFDFVITGPIVHSEFDYYSKK